MVDTIGFHAWLYQIQEIRTLLSQCKLSVKNAYLGGVFVIAILLLSHINDLSVIFNIQL